MISPSAMCKKPFRLPRVKGTEWTVKVLFSREQKVRMGTAFIYIQIVADTKSRSRKREP